jgi:hypothetical protein
VIAARQKKEFSHKIENVIDFPYDAAVASAWDGERYYYWLSTRRRADKDDSHRPHPDAIKLLVTKAMSHAEQLGLIFDSDGVTTRGTLHLYKDILSLQEEELRDVFERITLFAKLFNRIKGVANFVGFEKVLRTPAAHSPPASRRLPSPAAADD